MTTLSALFWLALASGASVTGTWRTIDDKTGHPRGVVRIFEQDGEYFGKVEAILKPEERNQRCVKCTDDRKDQPVLGMVILRHMKKRGAEYGGGDILDPETGSVYRCRIRVVEQGAKLQVRGYIGFALLGRTQVWLREQ